MLVCFVAPYFAENTLRTLRALVGLPGVRLGLISQDPAEKLAQVDPALRGAVVGHYRVDDALSGAQLIQATEAFAREFGPVDRLLGTLEQLQVPLGEARSACGIPGMSHAVALNFRDKARMKDVLRAAGLPVARHRLVAHPWDAHAFVAEVGFPIVIKPVSGVGARSTYRLRDQSELESAIQHLAPTPERALQAEEFVTGTEHTFETVMIGGEAVWWSGTHYLPSPLAVLENPWMQYTVLLPREESDHRAFHAINVAALVALGLDTGLSHMEWFRCADGRMVIGEVGARPPGVNIMTLMSLAFDVDMVERWCRLMVYGTWAPAARQKAAGCAFFRGQGRGERVVAVHGLDAAQREVGALIMDRSLPRIGQPVSTGYEGEGWAVVAADETEQVARALGTLVRTVRVELG